MINELVFKNLTVKYDGDKISKSKIKKIEDVTFCGNLVAVMLLIGVIFLEAVFLDFENNLGLSLFVAISSILVLTVGFVLGLTAFVKRIFPRHYEFINWLMKFKKDEIEVGWLNDRYIVQMLFRDWHIKNFGCFIPEDYILYESVDLSKPICMTIDLTKDKIEVTVKNK